VARLPKPGSDGNVWGEILNEYLGVEHNADGTLKARSDGSLLEGTTAPPGTNTSGSIVGSSVKAARADHTHKLGVHAGTHASAGADPLTPAAIGALAAAGLATYTVSGVAPSSPANGDVWWDTTVDLLKRWTGTTWAGLGSTTYASSNAVRPVATTPSRVPLTMIWGGQSSHPYGGSGGTITLHDTTDFAIGSESMKMVTNGSGGQTVLNQFGGPSVNWTNKVPVLWLKVENQAHVLDFKFWLGSSGFSNYYQWDLRENPAAYPILQDGQWVRLALPWGNAVVGGSPSRAALTDIQVHMYDDSAGQVTVHWGGFAQAPEPVSTWSNGVVSLAFDDGYASMFTAGRPYLDKYGFPATYYAITEVLWNHGAYPGYVTLAQAKQLEQQSGWEVASHAYTAAVHNANYTTLSSAAQLDDMRKAKNYLLSEGFSAADHFAYPSGAWNTTVVGNVRETFASARTVNSSLEETFPPADLMKLHSLAANTSTSLASLQAAVDRAYSNHEWLILTFHDIQASASGNLEISTANFQALVDYINTKGIPVRTVSDVLRS
jgi:peptidoglycan/xylan/chitin deacetylase (PgdA/CDA1 family)